jgi:hypothetical protein
VRAAALLTAAVLGLAVFGCGGSDESTATVGNVTPASLGYTKGLSGAERDAAAAVADYNAAIVNGDGTHICELTSRSEDALKACEENLGAVFDPTKSKKQPDWHLDSVKVSGKQAKITLKAPGAKPEFFTLVNDGGQWKILVVTNQR